MKMRLIVATLTACAALSFGCQDRPTSPDERGNLGPLPAKGGRSTINQTVTFNFRNEGTGDLIFGDERVPGAGDRTTYTTDECGVATLMAGYNGNANLNTKANTIKRDEAADCDNSTDARVFRVNFAYRIPVSGANDHLDWDYQTVNAKWMSVYYNIRDVQLGTPEYKKLKITFDDNGQHVGHGNGWGQACPYLLRFDSDWSNATQEVSEVLVTRLKQQSADETKDEWKIEAAAPNDDVAVCLDLEGDKPIILGYYHMPFQMNVVCEGEC